MVVIAGIDEAGLGPVLGPLIVSATAFEVPDELAAESMWRLLAGAVTKRPARRRGAIAIADSKKLYQRSRPRGLEHLERGVLAALAGEGQNVTTLGQLLSVVAPEVKGLLARYPWYEGGDLPLPRCISATDVLLAANTLSTGMKRAGVRPLGVASQPLLAEQYNTNVAATNNKSATLFDLTCRLLANLWRDMPPGRMRVFVDRHGGRRRYVEGLLRVFRSCRIKVLDESETLSAYRLDGGGREVELHFVVGGEEAQLPVALASMVSKYIRELFMEMFNSFWTERVNGLAPTAGYYVDGRRFYRQIAPAAAELGVDEQLVYRSR